MSLPDPLFAHAEAVVDLRALPLNNMRVEKDEIYLGALVDLQSMVKSTTLAAVADGILGEAAALAAHFGLRNLATIAGAIDGATDAPPGPPEVLLALLAMGAEVTTLAHGDRRTPLVSYRPAKEDALCEIILPIGAPMRGALARVARSPLDQAIVAAAAVVTPAAARVAVAGTSPAPFVVEAQTGAEPAATVVALIDAVAAHSAPQGDYRGSAAYRRAMAEVLARRALTQAFSNEANS
jgi:CO/xanthine dehydrogenase FAD-binding subunit